MRFSYLRHTDFSRRPSAPSRRGFTAAVLATSVAAVVSSKAAAAPPSAQELTGAKLPDAFTLVWRCTERHLPNKATSQAQLSAALQSIRQQEQTREIGAKEAAERRRQAEDRAKVVPPPRHRRVTLAASDGRLLFEVGSEAPGGAGGTLPEGAATGRALFDGKATTSWSAGDAAPGGASDHVEVSPGFAAGQIGPMPYLPLSQPGPAAVKDVRPGSAADRFSARVPLLEAKGAGDAPVYLDGSITAEEAGGRARVGEVLVTSGATPVAQWRYSDHVRIGDAWVPRRVERTSYYGAEKGVPQPSEVTEWVLESGSDQPLPAERFTPESWLKDQTFVQNATAGPGVSYSFRAGRGTLSAQAEDALRGPRRTAPPPAPAPVGLALLALLAAGASLHWWRTHRADHA